MYVKYQKALNHFTQILQGRLPSSTDTSVDGWHLDQISTPKFGHGRTSDPRLWAVSLGTDSDQSSTLPVYLVQVSIRAASGPNTNTSNSFY